MKTKKIRLHLTVSGRDMFGDEMELSEAEISGMEELIVNVCAAGSHFNFTSNGRTVFLPKKLIQKTIFRIEYLDNDESAE